jgi:uncharacterized protein (DUF2062 family)
VKFQRQIKYYYLRLIALRGEPHELALGIAFGVFSGMMPIVPFQTALAIMLSLCFKGSKIMAALGTWVSNPLNWYFIYYFSYRLGASIIGLPEKNAVFSSVMAAVRSGEAPMVIVGKIFGAGTAFVSAFLLGGFIMGVVFGGLCFFVFLPIFKNIRAWRQSRKERKNWRIHDQ